MGAGPEVDAAWEGLGVDCEWFLLCAVTEEMNTEI